ncbi:MAG TPA: heme ABC exporter ATP-binding protein CcmA [Aestuariivirga sp.]|nr:heme ABC exporter ATP-binding protein CcmA [Aestuariivirga sp.]
MKLIATNLHCVRGGRTVFRDLSFTLSSGELLQLTGPNGSGKSSLLRLIAGLSEPAAGALSLEGGANELSIGQQAHLIGHQDAIKPALTVIENLIFWTKFLGGIDAPGALAVFGFHDLSNDSAGWLSAGQKRRLALARLLAVPRALWLLDEPEAGLDGKARETFSNVMRSHLAQGGMILAATHGDLGIAPQARVELGKTLP